MFAPFQPLASSRSRSVADRSGGVRARFRRLIPGVAVVALALVTGCAGAPIQAMSDTRQTIRAAERAGAESAAPAELAEAREGLRRAEDNLKQRDYRAARREAESAHAKAIEALRASTPPAH